LASLNRVLSRGVSLWRHSAKLAPTTESCEEEKKEKPSPLVHALPPPAELCCRLGSATHIRLNFPFDPGSQLVHIPGRIGDDPQRRGLVLCADQPVFSEYRVVNNRIQTDWCEADDPYTASRDFSGQVSHALLFHAGLLAPKMVEGKPEPAEFDPRDGPEAFRRRFFVHVRALAWANLKLLSEELARSGQSTTGFLQLRLRNLGYEENEVPESDRRNRRWTYELEGPWGGQDVTLSWQEDHRRSSPNAVDIKVVTYTRPRGPNDEMAVQEVRGVLSPGQFNCRSNVIRAMLTPGPNFHADLKL
jgi:hypothetical protein